MLSTAFRKYGHVIQETQRHKDTKAQKRAKSALSRAFVPSCLCVFVFPELRDRICENLYLGSDLIAAYPRRSRRSQYLLANPSRVAHDSEELWADTSSLLRGGSG